jgi:hypothetical protein
MHGSRKQAPDALPAGMCLSLIRQRDRRPPSGDGPQLGLFRFTNGIVTGLDFRFLRKPRPVGEALFDIIRRTVP